MEGMVQHLYPHCTSSLTGRSSGKYDLRIHGINNGNYDLLVLLEEI